MSFVSAPSVHECCMDNFHSMVTGHDRKTITRLSSLPLSDQTRHFLESHMGKTLVEKYNKHQIVDLRKENAKYSGWFREHGLNGIMFPLSIEDYEKLIIQISHSELDKYRYDLPKSDTRSYFSLSIEYNDEAWYGYMQPITHAYTDGRNQLLYIMTKDAIFLCDLYKFTNCTLKGCFDDFGKLVSHGTTRMNKYL